MDEYRACLSDDVAQSERKARESAIYADRKRERLAALKEQVWKARTCTYESHVIRMPFCAAKVFRGLSKEIAEGISSIISR